MKFDRAGISRKAGLALVVLLVGVLASEAALAHGRRGRTSVSFGFFVGAPALAYSWHARPYYYPAYYYPPVYAAPVYATPVYVTPSPPPVYIEQPQSYAPPAPQRPAPQAAPETHWWYYCADTGAYYPYVKDCPTGWQRVAPQPPG